VRRFQALSGRLSGVEPIPSPFSNTNRDDEARQSFPATLVFIIKTAMAEAGFFQTCRRTFLTDVPTLAIGQLRLTRW